MLTGVHEQFTVVQFITKLFGFVGHKIHLSLHKSPLFNHTLSQYNVAYNFCETEISIIKPTLCFSSGFFSSDLPIKTVNVN